MGIVLLCVVAAVSYGVVHDQITARVCVDYFTIGHPPVFATTDPTLLGIGWGIIATWWVGFLIGVPLAAAARIGIEPKRAARTFIPPLLRLQMVAAFVAVLAGVCGWGLAHAEIIVLKGSLADRFPVEHHVAFLAAAWAHSASYLVGFVGGMHLIVSVLRSRRLGFANK